MKSFFLICFILVCSRLSAQEEILPPYRQAMLRTGAIMQSWIVDEYNEAITQLTFPFSLTLPISSRLNVTLSHSPALSYWRDNYRLHGFSDTWLQGTFIFWNEKALINIGLGVPTGKTHLSDRQFLMTKRWLSRNVFRFSSPLLGQGFCSRASLILALPIGNRIVVGVGGQFLYRASYYPVRFTYMVGSEEKIADRQYNPGDELSGHVGIDVRLSDDLKVMLDGMYTIYGRDTQEGVEVFGSGGKLNLRLAAYYRFNLNFIWIDLLYRQQGKNEVLQGFVFEREDQKIDGDQIEANIIAEAFRFDRGGIRALLDGRYHSRTQRIDAEELVIGGGVGLNYELSDTIEMDIRLKYLSGWYRSVADPDVNLPTWGLDIFAGLSAKL